MAYTKTQWVNNQAPALDADHLNHIEQGIKDAHDGLDEKADAADIPTKVSDLQNDAGYTSNQGTITGITMNGSSKGTSGSVDLGTVLTQHQDISGKQDTLVSGTNIKTINGSSLLGPGNIVIEGGGGGGSENIAADYSTSATYAVGDYCIYDGQLYRCTTAITTAEAWTAAHWTMATVGEELTDLKGDIPQNVSDLTNDANYQTASDVATAVNDDRPIWLDVPSFSSFPQTITDSRITSTMRVALIYFGTPSAVTSSGIDWTTSAGSVTITGSISGSTTATLKLEEPRT